ncbi:hypothetical protein BJV74DRAFT_782643 [Russula compacta]|nr:hypothetical protein BJV74DRAFT_782643 [Russula compacta]
MSHATSFRGNSSSFSRGRSLRPDLGNIHYFQRGGRYNFRGGRGGGTTHNFPPEADLKPGLDTSRIIETITHPGHSSVPEDIPIENVQYVTSYNWVDKEKPTIVVPGSPAVWTGRDVPFTLEPDDGSNFVDQNKARMSDYPMLPLFASADAIHGKEAPVDWPAVDVVTDRNGLRKLLRWLNPSEGKEVRDFRIDVDLVGTKTLVLSRWEGREREPLTGRSYGFAFEAAMTRAAPGCPISGHYRAITYDMLDIKMIVRFEVDACLPADAAPTKAGTSTTKCPEEKKPAPALDELADALESLNLQTDASSRPSSPSSSIDIVNAGSQVPQDALLEIASRSIYYVNQLDWNEIYPQLALSQTPGLRLGVHERGTFTELRQWEIDGIDLTVQRRRLAAQMVRLAHVLKDVQELAIARGSGPAGSFSLVCERGSLNVYGRKGAKSCLPQDVIARFAPVGAADPQMV